MADRQVQPQTRPARRLFPISSDLLGSDPTTDPIPLVSRLRGTPFQHVKSQAGVPDNILEAIDIVLRVAALSIRTGAGMKDVETNVLAAAAALGLADDHLEFDLTFTSAVISYAPPGTDPVVRVSVVRAPGRDYSRMTALHQLVLDMVGGELTRREAKARLEEVERSRKPYNRTAVRLAWGIMTAVIVLRLDGDTIAVATAFVATLIIDRLGEYMFARGFPYVITVFCGAGLATSLALILGHLGSAGLAPTDPQLVMRTSLVIAGGVMILLPGLQIIGVVEDGLWDYPLTAAGRLFQVMMQVAAILAGIAIPYAIAPSMGADVPQMRDPLSTALRAPGWTYLVLTFVATFFTAIGNRVPPKVLLVTALLGTLANAVQLFANAVSLPAAVGVLAAAVTVGAIGRVVAVRRSTPLVALTVTAITPLLPGLGVVESIRIMTHGDATIGMLRLMSAGTTACAIGAGVVIGAMLAVNMENGLEAVARTSSNWAGNRWRRSDRATA